MADHTPGPWRHTRFTGNKSWTVQRADTHEALANVRTGEADARLIASAPDMLAALKELQLYLEGSMPAAAHALMEAAIAKAEGRP